MVKTFSYCNISTKQHKDKGFFLLEVLVALVVLASMGAMIGRVLALASHYAGMAQRLMQATSYAAQAYEQGAHEKSQHVSYTQGIFTISREGFLQDGLPRCTVHVTWRDGDQQKDVTLGALLK